MTGMYLNLLVVILVGAKVWQDHTKIGVMSEHTRKGDETLGMTLV